MTDTPSSGSPSSSMAPAPASAPPPATAAGLRDPRVRWLSIVIVLLVVGLVGVWFNGRLELSDLRREVAQRLQSGDSLNNETRVLVKAMQESQKETQAKVAVLEGKQMEAQSQQLALEQLYQDLSRNRDEWALSEIEQVLSTASQQLQLAGDVRGALIALQNADSRLSRSDKPQFIAIRRAVARDIERLKALPTVDLTGLALRIDSVIGQIDQMPLLSDEKPSLPVQKPRPARAATPSRVAGKPAQTGQRWEWLSRLDNAWRDWSLDMWDEVRELIRVRTVRNPDALLLTPGESYYARENLKLRLLNARLALLSRNEMAFRNDLLAAQDTINRYFDTRARQTQTAQAILKQVQSSNLAIDMPTLSDSLEAVRNYRAKVQ